ncbi:MAG: hypothetical protein WC753_04765 [Candidatus Gracilibacteria bacterium]|jgi:hypothetical protein
MAANTAPIYVLTPKVQWDFITAANTALDGTGTVATVYTAGSNGAYVTNIIVKSNTTTATSAAGALRLFINNGSTNATPANNTLIREFVLTTVTASDTTATLNWEFPINFMLPAGYKIFATIATVAGSSGFALTAIGGDY